MLTLSLHMTKKEGKKGWQTNININIYLAHKQIPFDGFQCRFFIVLRPDNWIWKRLGMSRRNWRIYSHRFSARDEQQEQEKGQTKRRVPSGTETQLSLLAHAKWFGQLGRINARHKRNREGKSKQRGGKESDLLWIVNIKNITKEQRASTGPVKWNITTHQILACTNKHVPVCVCTFSFHSFGSKCFMAYEHFVCQYFSLFLFPLCCNFSLLFSIYFSAWTH